MSDSQPLQFTNDDGRHFSLRILRKDERYGDDDALTYDKDEPSVEFFDTSGFDKEEYPDILGYFTGIRCVISDFFLEVLQRNEPFSDSMSTWNISEANITMIQDWLMEQLSENEKQFIKAVLNPAKLTKAKKQPQQPRSFEEVMDAIESLEEPTFEEAYDIEMKDATFLQQQLEAAMRTLDLAETAESRWKNGNVDIRLQILAAKRRVLKAIALLNKPFHESM